MSGNARERQLFGVVGHPLSQSLSPLIHNWGFAQHDIPWTYMAWEIDPDHLPHFMVALRGLSISGASITIPHKQNIVPYVDRLSDTALNVGSVNTLFWRDGELWAENTDIAGFLAPLLQGGENIRSALILGAGGAALACIQGLRRIGVTDMGVAARNEGKARDLAQSEGIEALSWDQAESRTADILVNATPLGMKGKAEEFMPFTPDPKRFPLVYDLVYNPVRTRLLQAAEEAGCRTISGLSMFVNQAREQFRIWTGLDLEEKALTELVREQLEGK